MAQKEIRPGCYVGPAGGESCTDLGCRIRNRCNFSGEKKIGSAVAMRDRPPIDPGTDMGDRPPGR